MCICVVGVGRGEKKVKGLGEQGYIGSKRCIRLQRSFGVRLGTALHVMLKSLAES